MTRCLRSSLTKFSVQATVSSPTPVVNGSTIGPQPSPQAAAQQSPAAGQGPHQPPQQAIPPQAQQQPQDEGAAMLGRIAAVHADVDSLAARVSCAAFLQSGAEAHNTLVCVCQGSRPGRPAV